MPGHQKQQCLALLATALLISAAATQDVQVAARRRAPRGRTQRPVATPAAPKTCQTKFPNNCICQAGSCAGCESCAGCDDKICVAAPEGYSPIAIASYNPTAAAEFPQQLLASMKDPKPKAANRRTLLQVVEANTGAPTGVTVGPSTGAATGVTIEPSTGAATGVTIDHKGDWGGDKYHNGDSYGLVCDGYVHEIVIPSPPYPVKSPYNDPYNNPPGITCSRKNPNSCCGAQEHVDCDDRYESMARGTAGNVIKNIGPVNQNGDGTFIISPLDPLIFTLDKNSYNFLTFVEWFVYDVGPGGAKLVGNYNSGGGLQPDVNNYQWVPNGKQTSKDGYTQYCATCTSCVVGEGVTNMTLYAKPGTGYSSIELSQLYTDACCGATCVNLDGIYWTGMKYKCVKPTCGDTDLSKLGYQNFVCPKNYVYNKDAAYETTLDVDTCCKFAPTCGNTDPKNPYQFYPCSAEGCLKPPFEDSCWTNTDSASNKPLTGNSEEDLNCCCNPPTKKVTPGDVYVTKLANQPSTQVVGSTFQFTIQVGVNGVYDAICEDVELKDTLPPYLILESIVEDPFENACGAPSQRSFSCRWPYILKKEVKKIVLKVTATTAGEFKNVARVTSPNDTNPDNNMAYDKVRALSARCTNTLPEDCKPPKIFTKDKPCSAVDCVPIPEDAGACCLVFYGKCIERVKQPDCQKAGGRWTRGKLCTQVDCQPPVGACCNVKSGECYDDKVLEDCELDISTWKKDGYCTSDGYCSGSCCDTTSGDCVQGMKKECTKPGSVWSIYQQCNILTCPKDNQCIPPWWQCKPALYGQTDPCCPGYECKHSYKKCKAGEWVCKPKKADRCSPEYHSCGGKSEGVCCEGLTCVWDHKRYKGTCLPYNPDNCSPDSGSCKKDSDCYRGSRCAYGSCKPCARDSCYRDCNDYKCFEERKKDCNVFYSTAASL